LARLVNRPWMPLGPRSRCTSGGSFPTHRDSIAAVRCGPAPGRPLRLGIHSAARNGAALSMPGHSGTATHGRSPPAKAGRREVIPHAWRHIQR